MQLSCNIVRGVRWKAPRRRVLSAFFASLLGTCAQLGRAQTGAPPTTAAWWDALRQGSYVILMRHGQTVPGVFDPPGFRLGDCADPAVRTSQRNLSDEGLAQSRALGDTLRAQRVPITRVLSSQWCRCRDTAQAVVGPHREAQWLNSYRDPAYAGAGDAGMPQGAPRERREADTRASALALAQQFQREDGKGNTLLVTHQVNITAITGIVPAMGEWVVLKLNPARTKLIVVGQFLPT